MMSEHYSFYIKYYYSLSLNLLKTQIKPFIFNKIISILYSNNKPFDKMNESTILNDGQYTHLMPIAMRLTLMQILVIQPKWPFYKQI